MKTDWQFIRKTLNSAIDACEAVEDLGITEHDRSKTIELENGVKGSIFDFLTSSYTYPDTLKRTLIRARHKLSDDKAYTPETAKTLVNVAAACAEIIGALDIKTKVSGVNPHNPDIEQSITDMLNNMSEWYTTHMIPGLQRAKEPK